MIQNRFQQDYLPELYSIIPLNLYGIPWRWGRIPVKTQKCTHFPQQKNPPYKFTSSVTKSVAPSPLNSNFHLNTLYKLHLQLLAIAVVSLLLTSGFMYIHVMLIFINQCLLNVVFSIEWSKALNDQSSLKQYHKLPFNTIWKTLLLLMLVFHFFTLPFLFQTY